MRNIAIGAWKMRRCAFTLDEALAELLREDEDDFLFGEQPLEALDSDGDSDESDSDACGRATVSTFVDDAHRRSLPDSGFLWTFLSSSTRAVDLLVLVCPLCNGKTLTRRTGM